MQYYGRGRSTQATRGHSPAYSNQTALQQLAVSPLDDRLILTAEHSQCLDLPDEHFQADAPCDEQHSRQGQPADETDSYTEASELSNPHPVTSTSQIDSEFNAEDAWRRLMGIATQVASSASIKALNSMSEHVTASESPETAKPIPDRMGIFDMAISSPRSKASNPSEHTQKHSDVPLDGSQQPIELPVVTSRLPARPPQILPEDDHGESLWRDFIIGSQDSESEDELHMAWQRKRKRRRSSGSEQSQSFQLSGLGTSDKATQGGTVALSSPSFVQIELDESERSEGIGDFPPNLVAETKGAWNIHASSPMRWLSKKPKRRGTNGPR